MAGIVTLAGRVGSIELLGADAGAPSALGSMAIDDAGGAGGAFADGDDALDDNAGATAFDAVDFDSYTVDQATGVATIVATFPVGSSFNGNIVGRISLHFGPASGVSLASTTLFGGVDQQSHQKENDHALELELEVTPSDQS